MRDDGDYRIDDIGTELSFTRMRSSFVADADPLSARALVECRATYRRSDCDVRVETDVEMTCDAEAFHFTARLTATTKANSSPTADSPGPSRVISSEGRTSGW